jgi:hypothetical protein
MDSREQTVQRWCALRPLQLSDAGEVLTLRRAAARMSLSTGPRSLANLRLYRRLGYVIDGQSTRRAESDYIRLVKVL